MYGSIVYITLRFIYLISYGITYYLTSLYPHILYLEYDISIVETGKTNQQLVEDPWTTSDIARAHNYDFKP